MRSAIYRTPSVGMAVKLGCRQRCFHPVTPFLWKNTQRCGILACQFRIKRKSKTAPHRSTVSCGLGTILPSNTMSDSRFCDRGHRFRIWKWFPCDRSHFPAAGVECNLTKRETERERESFSLKNFVYRERREIVT